MGAEVPLRILTDGKARKLRAGRSAVVWACLGVCSVVLVKAVVLGGLGSATFSLLDPRFGGVDGLGVLTSAQSAPARKEELATVGRNMDVFRDARGAVAGAVPRHGVSGSLFGDDGHGKLPGVNQDAWIASKMGQGVHFLSDKPHFVRAPHPRRPMLRRVDRANAIGPLAHLPSHRTPDALARIVSRGKLLRERARLAGLNDRNNAMGALGSLPSPPQDRKDWGPVDRWAGGTLFRAGTTATSTGGSLSPQFKSDRGNADGALAALHGDQSWKVEAPDNGWASAVKDDGWATAVHDDGWAAGTHDNGWAKESKQNGWASAVHDDGWASSPSAAAAHGALMSIHSGNPMGSLSQVTGRQDGWSAEPSRATEQGALANTKSGNVMGSLAQTKSGNRMGGLSQMKEDATNAMGSLAALKADPETNGDLANFKQIQAETDGALSSLKDVLDATASLSGVKASNSAGSLANTKGSDVWGSLSGTKGSDVWGSLSGTKGSDVWGSLSGATGQDLANGVLSVTKNGEDVDGTLSGFKYGKQGEQFGGSLANVHGSDIGGSLSAVKSSMTDGVLSTGGGADKHEMMAGALAAVGGKVDRGEMIGGSLSAVPDHPQRDGWLSQAPGLRGRLVKTGAGGAASQRAAKTVAESEKQVQKTEEQAAALHYMLGKELNEAYQKRAALRAEQKVKEQEKKLEAQLEASKHKVEAVEAQMEHAAAAAKAARGDSKAVAASAEAVGKGPDAASSAVKGKAQAGKAASGMRNAMHVAKGQQKKQQKLDEDEGDSAADDNEDDIGWHKTHWSTLAWVMFIMFGPVFTTAVVGLVGYYTGTVAALATCLLLVCMDIACYYYSWFLW